MSEFWKANPRWYCEYCKVWILDNKASRRLHEGGTKHKSNVRYYLHNVQKKRTEKEREEEEVLRHLNKMKHAANKQMAQNASSGFTSNERRFDLREDQQQQQQLQQSIYGAMVPVPPSFPPPTLEELQELQRKEKEALYDPEGENEEDESDSEDEDEDEDEGGKEEEGDDEGSENEGSSGIVIPKTSKKRKKRERTKEKEEKEGVVSKSEMGIQGKWEEIDDGEAQSAWGLPYVEQSEIKTEEEGERKFKRRKKEKSELDSSDSDLDEETLNRVAEPTFIRRSEQRRVVSSSSFVVKQEQKVKEERDERQEGVAEVPSLFKKRKFSGARRKK